MTLGPGTGGNAAQTKDAEEHRDARQEERLKSEDRKREEDQSREGGIPSGPDRCSAAPASTELYRESG